MAAQWPPVDYETWAATCDTLHAHTQVLGKLATALAPPSRAPACRAAGYRPPETLPLPALTLRRNRRDLDLCTHEGDRRAQRRPPARRADARPAGRRVTRQLLEVMHELGGEPIESTWPAGGVVDGLARRGRRALPTTRRRSTRTSPPRPCSARARGLPPFRGARRRQRLVRVVRPRRQPVLGPAGRAAVRRLHHAQRHGLPGGRGRLVARRPALRARSVLRLCPPG